MWAKRLLILLSLILVVSVSPSFSQSLPLSQSSELEDVLITKDDIEHLRTSLEAERALHRGQVQDLQEEVQSLKDINSILNSSNQELVTENKKLTSKNQSLTRSLIISCTVSVATSATLLIILLTR